MRKHLPQLLFLLSLHYQHFTPYLHLIGRKMTTNKRYPHMRRYSLSNKLVIFQLSIKRIKRRRKAQNNATDYTGFPQFQVISYKAAQITAYPHKDHEVYAYPAEYGECL